MTSNNEVELKDFIKSVLDAISQSVTGDYHLSHDIELEVAVIKKSRGKAGFNVFVVDAEGKYSKESISRIKIKIGKIGETEGTKDLPTV